MYGTFIRIIFLVPFTIHDARVTFWVVRVSWNKFTQGDTHWGIEFVQVTAADDRTCINDIHQHGRFSWTDSLSLPASSPANANKLSALKPIALDVYDPGDPSDLGGGFHSPASAPLTPCARARRRR